MHSWPPKVPHSEDEEQAYKATWTRKEQEVSEAFMNYLSSKGRFNDWEKNKEVFQHVHVSDFSLYQWHKTYQAQGDNPLAMWSAFLQIPSISELADLSMLLLGISMNQARLEQSFSDLKIKKTQLWNHLKLPKLEKMAKVCMRVWKSYYYGLTCFQVGANICTSQKEARFVEAWTKCQNHEKANIVELLTVPWYADVMDEDGDASKDKAHLQCHSQGWWNPAQHGRMRWLNGSNKSRIRVKMRIPT